MNIRDHGRTQLEVRRPPARGEGVSRNTRFPENLCKWIGGGRHQRENPSSEQLEETTPCDHSLVFQAEPKLRGFQFLGRFEPEMGEGPTCEHPATRGTLNKPLLDQVGLDDILDRIARF